MSKPDWLDTYFIIKAVIFEKAHSIRVGQKNAMKRKLLFILYKNFTEKSIKTNPNNPYVWCKSDYGTTFLIVIYFLISMNVLRTLPIYDSMILNKLPLTPEAIK